MKNIFKSILAAAALVSGLAACTKEIAAPEEPVIPAEEQLVEVTLGAGIGLDTKTSMGQDENGSILWTNGDKIAVVGNSGRIYEFTTTLNEPSTTASFTGYMTSSDAQSSIVAAAYPYASSLAYDNGQISGLAVPASQGYVVNSFCEEALPMTASIDGTSLTFTAVASVVKVNAMILSEVTSVELVLKTSESEQADTYSMTFAKESTSSTDQVSLIFVVEPKDYRNGSAKLVVNKSNGTNEYDVTAKYMEASKRYYIGIASDAVASIGAKGYATLAAAVADVPNDGTETTITLFANAEDSVTVEANKNIVLDLNGKTLSSTSGSTITNNGTLEVKNTSNTEAWLKAGLSSFSDIGVKNNAGATLKMGENIKLYAYTLINNAGSLSEYKSTAYASAYGIYNTGTATVNGGKLVGSNTVYQAGGNVTISGGDFTARIWAEAGDSLTITGGTLTSTGYGIISKIPVAISGDASITASSYGVYLWAGTNASLTMNGGSITSTDNIGVLDVANNKVEILSGTVTSKKQGVYTEGAKVAIGGGTNSAVLNAEDGPAICMVAAYGAACPAELTVNEGASIKSVNHYGVVTNGSNSGQKITIHGGTIESENWNAFYLPACELFTMYGGTIKGSEAITAKGGTYNISGGTLIGNGEAEEPTEGGESGAYATGSAFYIEDNYAYSAGEGPRHDVVLNISGGTFTSEHNHAVSALFNAGTTDSALKVPAQITITGGQFNAPAGKEVLYTGQNFAGSLLASGGIFSAQPNEAFVAEGKTVVANTDEATKVAYPYTIGDETNVAKIGTTKYATLAAALVAAQSGDVIEILDGTWGAEAIGKLDPAGSYTNANIVRYKSLTIKPATGATATFTSNVSLGYDDSSTANATMTVKGLTFSGASLMLSNYVQNTVEDCTFTNGTSSTAGVLIVQDACCKNHKTTGDYPASQITIKNCSIDGSNDGASGMRLRNSGNVTIEGCTIKNSKFNGILFESNGSADNNASKTISIKNNTITEWNSTNTSGQGRAMRLALGTLASGSTVTVSGNTMHKEALGLDTPDFLKATGCGSASVDISGNYWSNKTLSEVKDKSDVYTSDVTATITSVITTK